MEYGKGWSSGRLHGFHHFICWILSFSCCITLPIKPQAGTSHFDSYSSCRVAFFPALSLIPPLYLWSFTKNSLSFFYPALYSPSFQSFQSLFLCLKLPVSYHQYSLHILISTHIYANCVCWYSTPGDDIVGT